MQMLFKPSWDRLSDFRNWVAEQPARGRYDYSNSENCACAKYLQDRGKFHPGWMRDWSMGHLDDLASNHCHRDGWVYGKLLKRIDANIAEHA
jgi:hypothetical protein